MRRAFAAGCAAVLLLAAARTSSDADRDHMDMVFVTTDPATDDAQTLRRYLDPDVVEPAAELHQLLGEA